MQSDLIASGSGLVVTPPKAEVTRTVPDDPQHAMIELRLTNRARSMAEIQSVRTSCGCTIADDPSQTVLQPGETATLRVKASLPKYGVKQSTVTITSSIEGKTEQVGVPLVLRGDEPESPYVEIIPERIELRSAGTTGAVEREFQIQTVEADSEEPWILGMKSSLPQLKTEIIAVKQQSRRGRSIVREYQVRVTADARSGSDQPLSGWLTVAGKTDATRESSPVFVKVEPTQLLTLSPSRLVFTKSDMETGSATRTVVMTTTEAGRDAPVVSVTDSWISSLIVPTSEAHVSLLKVRVTFPGEGSASESSLIQTDLAVSLAGNEKALLRLPVIVQR